MKKSFAAFWKRNLGFFRLAVITNLEYRVNYFTDAVLQPLASTLIEITLWVALFAGAGRSEIAGFGQAHYISYVLWAAFIARITSTWMYEFRMIDEIDSGKVNSLIVRPFSFYEYYLSQFMGYKIITTMISLLVPALACLVFRLPTDFNRLAVGLLLVLYYLILVHTISFCVACMAFFLNKVHSFTVAKNLCLWLLSGELFPLDLLPLAWKNILLYLPFSNGAYVPVAYITGRVDISVIQFGFINTSIGILFFGALGTILWRHGMKSYAGAGA